MPPCSRANVMSAPFDRIQKHTIRVCRVCDNGKGGCCGLEAKTARKVSGLSRDPVFLHHDVCIVHGGRAALDKSPFDLCLSDFEWNGNSGNKGLEEP